MTHFTLKATYDIVCPWCYIGHKQLKQAQTLWYEKHSSTDDTFSVTYEPFQLAPDWPRGPASSISKESFYIERFGQERTQQIHARLYQVGAPIGINFKFGGQTGNSRDAHRLVQLAQKREAGPDDGVSKEKLGTKILDGLFAAYFENERDITDYAVLRDVAVQAGIPAEEFEQTIMKSDQWGPEVDEAVRKASLGGVNGVPDFVIQDRYRLRGATEQKTFVGVFEKVKAAI